jgi:hypothetical protein
MQMALINPLLKKLGTIGSWKFLPKDKFIHSLSNPNDADFLFFDFGVADPEPLTWVSLIVNMKFVYLDNLDEDRFKKIAKSESSDKSSNALKSLLENVAKKGGYVPMFHFSTLSVAQPGISFEKIRALDETVDYSKIVFK